MVIITKLQRIFYSIQSTLIVTNTFLAASVCDSHCTGTRHVHACECVSDWKSGMQKLEADGRVPATWLRI